MPRNRGGVAWNLVLWATCLGMSGGAWAQYIDRYMRELTCRLNRQNREWTSFVVGWNVAAAGVEILIELKLMSTGNETIFLS